MPETRLTAQDENLAIRYLLGLLDGRNKIAFEERYFHDEGFFEYLCAVEDELIDQFLEHRLSWWKRRRFKKVYWSSPDRRQRVAAAQQMMQAFAPGFHISFWQSVVDLIRTQSANTQMVIALATILVVLGPWLVVGALLGFRGGAERSGVRRGPTEIARQVPAQGATVASFLLEPGTTRSATEGSHRFIIPRTANLVRVELALYGRPSGNEYRVKLLIAGGIEVWRESLLKAHATSGGPVVAFYLPTELLTHTDYVFALEGVDQAGHFLAVGSYGFALVRE